MFRPDEGDRPAGDPALQIFRSGTLVVNPSARRSSWSEDVPLFPLQESRRQGRWLRCGHLYKI
jgi:hypothetical protein